MRPPDADMLERAANQAALLTIAGSVFHHPSNQLAKRKTCMSRHFWHERGLRHPGLSVDFQYDEFARTSGAVVVPKVRAAYATAPECSMSLKRQLLNFLVNIRFKFRWKNVF